MSRLRVARLLSEDSPAFAVGDQLGMVGANFILGVIVARCGTMEDFAQFGVLYALLVFLNFLHGPLLNEPLVLTSASDGLLRSRSSLRVMSILFLPAAGLVALAAPFQVESAKLQDLTLLFFAGVGSVFYWSSKAELHCALRHRGAFLVTVATSLLMVSFVGLAISYGVNASTAALMAIALSTICGGIFGQLIGGPREGRLDLSGALLHARIGVPSAAALWMAANGTVLLLAHLGRFDDVAGLRVVLAVLIPVNQVLIGLSSFLLPRFARQAPSAANSGGRELWRLIGLCCIAAAVFSGVILVCGDFVLGSLYGMEYERFSSWLSIGALVLPLCWVVITLLRTRLRGVGKGGRLLGIYTLSLLAGLPVSYVVLVGFGGISPILSFSSIQICIAVVFMISFLRDNKVGHGR